MNGKFQLRRGKHSNNSLTMGENGNITYLNNNKVSLITLDINRLVIPKKYQKKLLETDYMSHLGKVRTYKSLQMRYFWPQLIGTWL